MLSVAEQGDEATLETFLVRYPETSMFLRGNLARHGISGSGHPRATRYWLWRDGGDVQAVFGRSNAGFLMCQMPRLDADAMQAFARAIEGQTVIGTTGDSAQIQALVQALGLDRCDWSVSRDEPLMSRTLDETLYSDLRLRRPAEADLDTLGRWFAQYELDTGLSQDEAASRTRSQDLAARAVQNPDLRLYEKDGAALGMTAFNAALPDMVQVGGVFVRRAFRNAGIGRGMVAAHLAEARAAGVRRAILFAANTAAARAYQAIGFAPVGTYRVGILKTSHSVEARP